MAPRHHLESFCNIDINIPKHRKNKPNKRKKSDIIHHGIVYIIAIFLKILPSRCKYQKVSDAGRPVSLAQRNGNVIDPFFYLPLRFCVHNDREPWFRWRLVGLGDIIRSRDFGLIFEIISCSEKTIIEKTYGYLRRVPIACDGFYTALCFRIYMRCVMVSGSKTCVGSCGGGCAAPFIGRLRYENSRKRIYCSKNKRQQFIPVLQKSFTFLFLLSVHGDRLPHFTKRAVGRLGMESNHCNCVFRVYDDVV